MKKLITLLFILISYNSYSQSIVRGEYFFDTDPGIGAATNFTFGSVTDSVETTLSIPTNGLSLGLHVLYLRTLNDSGSWSLSEARMFNIINQTSNTSIATAEYFFDTDPGVGAGTALSVGTAADSVEFNPQITTNGISNGLHVLYIRTKNTDGVWSLSEPRMVNVISSSANNPIVAAEYFFDTDPGVGLGGPLTVGTAADSVEFFSQISAVGQTLGLHVLYIRTKNTSGVWSLSEPRMVNIIQNVQNQNIIAGEYFIDNDPGIGLAYPFNTGAPSDSIEVIRTLPFVNTLSIDTHYVFMRTKNNAGVWSLSEGRMIVAFPCVPSATITNPSDTVAFCSGNPITLTADSTGAYGYLWSTGDTTQTIQLDTGGVVTVEVFDAFGCSAIDTIYSNLGVSPAFANCTDITLNADSGQCGAIVNFNALGLSGNPFPIVTYNQNPGTFFPVGTTSINASATNTCSTETCNFNVIVIDNQLPTITAPPAANLSLSGTSCSITNPNLGTPVTNDNCGTFTVNNNAPTEFFPGSTLVTWTINDGNGNTASANQIVNVNGNVNFGIALNAASTNLANAPMQASFTNGTPNLSSYNFIWYFGDGTMLPSNASNVTHTYNFNGVYNVSLVAINSNGCSDTLILNNYITCTGDSANNCNHTVSTNPSGIVNACIGSTVPINSNTNLSNAIYQWNRNGVIISGASQPEYYATQDGNYTLTVFNAQGCPITSTVVQINYNLPSSLAPTITATGNPGPCGNVNMVLTANGSFTNYLWSNGQTGNSINVTQGGTYTVTGQSPACDAVSLPFDIVGSNAPVPPICMVTVDETDNKNIIIWEKPITDLIQNFVILREEINNPGVYTQIHSQDYVTLSEFKDTGSYADQRAYRYKIAVEDTCDGFTVPSNAQRSMHLDVTQGNSVLARSLNWNVYQGQPQAYTHYLIYRETAPGNLNLQLIDSVASSQTWYSDNSLSNLNDTLRAYMIAYRITTPCVSSRATNQLCQSNVTSAEFVVVDGIHNISHNEFDFNIYPNPNHGQFVISIASPIKGKTIQAKVHNALGTLMNEYNLMSTKNIQMDLSSLPNGVYFVSLSDANYTKQQRVVIVR
ncbi:MAG TPA: T9SS type A sorting domain-containing protein [Bacteroidia bacterium]|nr:T9SS type A sorting domain-containing protein [Bacteroidia bacterium]